MLKEPKKKIKTNSLLREEEKNESLFEYLNPDLKITEEISEKLRAQNIDPDFQMLKHASAISTELVKKIRGTLWKYSLAQITFL